MSAVFRLQPAVIHMFVVYLDGRGKGGACFVWVLCAYCIHVYIHMHTTTYACICIQGLKSVSCNVLWFHTCTCTCRLELGGVVMCIVVGTTMVAW